MAMSLRSRAMQDFCAWPAYGTAEFWNSILENPQMASELMCQRVSKLGAINSSEPTCASVAAHAAVATYGLPGCVALQAAQIQDMYESVKAFCMHGWMSARECMHYMYH